MTKRIFDLILAIPAFVIFIPIYILIAFLISIDSPGPILYWSKRIGKNNTTFLMPKFRSMYVNTPQLATHLLNESSDKYITKIGKLLRKTSLDELPQLWSIIKGEMSFVGPRPALFNQDDLIELRTTENIHSLVPGVTGWAQINGRDEIPIPEKVRYDKEYYSKQSLLFDIKIIFLTVLAVIKKDGISH